MEQRYADQCEGEEDELYAHRAQRWHGSGACGEGCEWKQKEEKRQDG